ncbi:MAG: multifunctional CCA addition/repair protein, partial [Gammaproteobacteria bacterium]
VCMDTYLVGGAVRDRLLGLPVREKDWVVVGGNPETLEAKGYRKVGKSFPVFLHPETGEEYALARTEKKTGPGYHGFEVYAGEDVTLEQDLQRRDLTINAIAQDTDGQLIDPCGGANDLNQRVLRHVSDAFNEDPLRILRVARFAARFHTLGFTVAPETMALMRDMSADGDVNALVPERVWRETELALSAIRPDIFIQVLRDCGALAIVFPEVDALYGVPQPEKWHPEIDTGVHIEMALRSAALLSDDASVRFAILMHDLGKGKTPETEWPRHHGHEHRSAELTHVVCDRVNAPNRFRDLALHVAEHHALCHRALELRPETILKLLERVDAFRRPDRFALFLLACEADLRGRKGMEQNPYPQAELMEAARTAAAEVDTKGLAEKSEDGKEIGALIKAARLAAIRTVRENFRSD